MTSRLLVPGFDWVPAWWLGKLQPWGRKDGRHREPDLLVVHCGAARADVARYIADPVDDAHAPGAVLCHDGHWRRQVATHAAWFGTAAAGRLVQQVGLELEAWGTGSSPWHGAAAQRRAIHVELPGPPSLDRAGRQVEELRRWAEGCKEIWPSLTHWIRHSDIDNTRHDPGPGLPEDWAEGLLERG